MAANEKAAETAPDPEEDDLDDLDDVLDEFNPKPAIPTEPKPAAPSASGPGRPAPPSPTAAAEFAVEDTLTTGEEQDLEKQLQAGMNSLISELGENPEMQKQFEDMMQELIAAGAAPTQSQAAEHVKRASENMPEMPGEEVKSGTAGAAGGGGGKKEESFQDTIKKTMERMQQSGDAATAATSSGAAGGGGGSSEEEMLMEMMKSLQGGSGAVGEGGNEEDFNSMLMSMMTQLTNKEILYEPMKELHEKFPAWMEKHAEGKSEKAEDLERYKEQQRLVGEIVGRFQTEGYSDGNEGDREFIVERMQKMQAQGSPPPDLVGDMSAAQEALGDLDAGCPTQ